MVRRHHPWAALCTTLAALVGHTTACNVSLELPASATVSCGADGSCPVGRVCLSPAGVCVLPDSPCVERVDGGFRPAANGNQCSVDGTAGVCREGGCVAAFCGDGFAQTELGEQCDDGNANENDACGACRRNAWAAEIAFGVGQGGRLPDRASVPFQRVMTQSDRGLILGTAELRRLASAGGPSADALQGLGALISVSGAAGLSSYLTGSTTGLLQLEETTRAALVQLGLVSGLATGPDGELAIATNGVYVFNGVFSNVPFILQLGRDDEITIVTGNGSICSSGSCGDEALARFGGLTTPGDLTFDRAGELLFVDDKRVRRIDGSGYMRAVAGGSSCSVPGDSCGDDGSAVVAGFIGPLWIAVSAAGRIVVSDAGAHRLRVIDTDGTIRRYIGTGVACDISAFPNCPDTAPLRYPTAVVMSSNTLFVVDRRDEPVSATDVQSGLVSQGGDVVRMFTLDASETPVAQRVVLGTGVPCIAQPCGDGSAATAAATGAIWDIALRGDGSLVVIDEAASVDELGFATPSRIRRVDLESDRVSNLFGQTSASSAITLGERPAAGAKTTDERTITALADNELLFATSQQIFRVDVSAQTVRVFAGLPNTIGCDVVSRLSNGDAATFPFCDISALASQAGRIFVVDNQRVFAIDGGVVQHVFGSGVSCPDPYCADVSDARSASLKQIAGITADDEFLYVTDDVGNAVWRASFASGGASRIAGDGTRGSAGDGGDAIMSTWRCPQGIAVAAPGVIDVADVDNCRVRRLQNGVVSTLIAPGACPDSGTVDTERCASWSTQLPAWAPQELARAGDSLYVATGPMRQVWRFDGAGLALVAGAAYDNQTPPLNTLNEGAAADAIAFSGDRVLPFAPLRRDLSIAANLGSGLFVSHAVKADRVIRNVRDGRLVTIAGDLDQVTLGDFTTAELVAPLRSVLSDDGILVVDSGFIRRVDLANRRVETLFGATNGDPPEPLRLARYTAVEDGVVAVTTAGADTLYAVTRGEALFAIERDAERRWRVARTTTLVPQSGEIGAIEDLVYVEDDVIGPVLYASDADRNVIYSVDPAMRDAVTQTAVVAGQLDTVGGAGDGGDAVAALLDKPRGLAVSRGKNVYVADAGNRRVRRLRRDAAGVLVIEPVANVDAPRGIAFDAFGNLVVATGASVELIFASAAAAGSEPDVTSGQATIFSASSTPETRDGLVRCLSSIVSDQLGSFWAFDACTGVALELRRDAPLLASER